MRICSFLPSATEIVYVLDLQDDLHGVTHECDFPPEARTKPQVVRSVFREGEQLSSAEISTVIFQKVGRGTGHLRDR